MPETIETVQEDEVDPSSREGATDHVMDA